MSFFFLTDEWIVVALLVLLLAFSAECGYRFGRSRAKGQNGRETYLTHEASALGVLALLLGFTFSLAAQRFETRRNLILEEANAVGTAALRAQLLPQPIASETGALLQRYALARIALSEAGIDLSRRSAAIKEAEELQNEIWKLAHAALDLNRLDVGTGLYIESLNTVIDAHEKRITAFSYHIPDAIYLLIFGVGALAFGLSGAAAGVNQSRSRLPTFVMVVLVSSVVLFIADLDRPQRGLLTISDQSLRDVARAIGTPDSERRP